jgi:hypothetical protein
MQLPRGTFREIRKKVVLQDILFELEETQFSGTCGIVAGPATGSFVFHNGNCILAKFHGQAGDAGIREMQQSARDAVDVIISSLDETQIKLAIEFNPGCRVISGSLVVHDKVAGTSAAPAHNSPFVHPAAPRAPPARPGRRVLITGEIPLQKKSGETDQVPSHVVARAPPEKPVAPAAEEPDDFESDIDALDSMDLDLVTSRIRGECKTLVKHLELDHLLER